MIINNYDTSVKNSWKSWAEATTAGSSVTDNCATNSNIDKLHDSISYEHDFYVNEVHRYMDYRFRLQKPPSMYCDIKGGRSSGTVLADPESWCWEESEDTELSKEKGLPLLDGTQKGSPSYIKLNGWWQVQFPSVPDLVNEQEHRASVSEMFMSTIRQKTVDIDVISWEAPETVSEEPTYAEAVSRTTDVAGRGKHLSEESAYAVASSETMDAPGHKKNHNYDDGCQLLKRNQSDEHEFYVNEVHRYMDYRFRLQKPPSMYCDIKGGRSSGTILTDPESWCWEESEDTELAKEKGSQLIDGTQKGGPLYIKLNGWWQVQFPSVPDLVNEQEHCASVSDTFMSTIRQKTVDIDVISWEAPETVSEVVTYAEAASRTTSAAGREKHLSEKSTYAVASTGTMDPSGHEKHHNHVDVCHLVKRKKKEDGEFYVNEFHRYMDYRFQLLNHSLPYCEIMSHPETFQHYGPLSIDTESWYWQEAEDLDMFEENNSQVVEGTQKEGPYIKLGGWWRPQVRSVSKCPTVSSIVSASDIFMSTILQRPVDIDVISCEAPESVSTPELPTPKEVSDHVITFHVCAPEMEVIDFEFPESVSTPELRTPEEVSDHVITFHVCAPEMKVIDIPSPQALETPIIDYPSLFLQLKHEPNRLLGWRLRNCKASVTDPLQLRFLTEDQWNRFEEDSGISYIDLSYLRQDIEEVAQEKFANVSQTAYDWISNAPIETQRAVIFALIYKYDPLTCKQVAELETERLRELLLTIDPGKLLQARLGEGEILFKWRYPPPPYWTKEAKNDFNVVVYGSSGAGKSEVIRSILKKEKHPANTWKAFKTGVIETTKEPRCVRCENFVLWDIPGSGTSSFKSGLQGEEYVREFGLFWYDCSILVTNSRIMQVDVELATQFQKHEKFKGKVFAVRSQADEAYRKKRREAREDGKKPPTRKEVADELRMNFLAEITKEGIAESTDVYILGLDEDEYMHAFDFDDLYEHVRHEAMQAIVGSSPTPANNINVYGSIQKSLTSNVTHNVMNKNYSQSLTKNVTNNVINNNLTDSDSEDSDIDDIE